MTDPIFVDTLDSALTAFQRIRLERKIAVDLEGIDLSRDGKLCIAQVGLTSDPEIVFIFDVIALGRDLFTHGLKEILESAAIIKLVYDIRCDSDALFHQFGVTPKPVFDVQVACMKAFGVGGRFVLGLGKMIERYYPDGAKKAQMKSIKEVGLSLFAPELGGGYHVWEQRPLRQALIAYAAADIGTMIVLSDIALEKLVAKGVTEASIISIAEMRLQKTVAAPHFRKGKDLAIKDF